MQDKYGYEKQEASYIAGAAYDVSMILSPFLGGIIVSKCCLQIFLELTCSYVYTLQAHVLCMHT